MVSERGRTFSTPLTSNLTATSKDDNHTAVVNEFTIAYQLSASEIIPLILPVVEKIISIPVDQLYPNAITNSLFTSLVDLICIENLKEDDVSLVLSNSAIVHYQNSLMQQCSSAEYFLEASFAREIESGKKCIEDFIYYNNYKSLVQFEMDSLKLYTKNISISEVAIIGSGPLPLTSVEILKHLSPSVIVNNYDHSEEAVELAKIVVKNEERIFVKNRTAVQLSAEDLSQVNVVYLAALVGVDKMEKKKIIEHLYDVMKPGSVLIARSALGLKTLVYRRITTDEFGLFKNIQEFHPKDKKVLNSIMCGTR